MSKVIIDSELQSRLNGLDEQIELCTQEGATLGWFIPDVVYRRLVYSQLKSRHSREEIRSLKQQSGGSTLEEIWRELGK